MVLEAEAEDNPAGRFLCRGLPYRRRSRLKAGPFLRAPTCSRPSCRSCPTPLWRSTGRDDHRRNERTEAFFGYSAQEVEGKT